MSQPRMDNPQVNRVKLINPQRVQRGLDQLLDDDAYADLAAMFRALADPTRAKIVQLLADQPFCVSELAQVVGASDPAISQHLRLLRALRIVRGRRSGKMVYYSLEDEHVRALLRMALDHHDDAPDRQQTTGGL